MKIWASLIIIQKMLTGPFHMTTFAGVGMGVHQVVIIHVGVYVKLQQLYLFRCWVQQVEHKRCKLFLHCNLNRLCTCVCSVWGKSSTYKHALLWQLFPQVRLCKYSALRWFKFSCCSENVLHQGRSQCLRIQGAVGNYYRRMYVSSIIQFRTMGG